MACCATPWDEDQDEMLEAPMVAPAVASIDAQREEMLDGLKIRRKSPLITDGTRTLISLARTAVLGAMLAGTGYAIYATRDWTKTERLEPSKLQLLFEACTPPDVTTGISTPLAEPRLVGLETGTDAGLKSELALRGHKIFKFSPNGDSDLAGGRVMDSMWYYDSEETYATPWQSAYAYSLYMFGNRALQFNIQVKNVACLGDTPAAREAAQNKLGAIIVKELDAADRRSPRSSIPLVPEVHGAMLMTNRENKLWSVARGEFYEVYHKSAGMTAYEFVVPAFRVALTAVVLALVGRAALGAWWRATEVWVLQYDFLYAPDEWQMFAQYNNQKDFLKSRVRERSAWRLSHLCGVFWVLDHVTGDAVTNAENFWKAMSSTLVHGLSMIKLAILPIVHARFFPEYQTWAYGLVAGHFLQCFGFGACYYFGVSENKRRNFYYGYLITALGCLCYSLVYLSGIVQYTATRAVVMPQEAGAVVGAVTGVLVYAVTVAVGLRTMRHRLVRNLKDNTTKGLMESKLRKSGLDVRSVWTNIVGGTVIISLLGSMIVLVSGIYFQDDSNTQYIAGGLTAGIAFVMGSYQLQSRFAAVKATETDNDDF